jgi:hypothetical protein
MSDCLFCGSELAAPTPRDLDANERIAFDARLGRLWQVCAECGRWNLTPIESRWEIVEECESIASRAAILVETERLALLSCGAGQLIRVGAPARHEFAEWRYSSRLDRFRSIRRLWERALMSLPELPIGGYGIHGTAKAIPQAWVGSPFIEHGAVLSALFSSAPLVDECPSCAQPLFIHPAAFGEVQFELRGRDFGLAVTCGLCGDEVIVELQAARPAVRAGLALVSRQYRDVAQVQRAIAPLDRMGGPWHLLQRLSRRRMVIGELPRLARLALWVALDELAEAEALEAEWSYAETLAHISDNELTDVPGFSEFKLRVLSENPRS